MANRRNPPSHRAPLRRAVANVVAGASIAARTRASLVLAALALSLAPTITHAADRHGWTKPNELRIGVVRDFDTLDPLISTQAAVTDIAQFIFSGLIRYDDKGDPIPDVALAVPSRANGGISADGKTITYKLRPDAAFSDGVALTADDVVFTWKQILNPNNNVPNRFPYDEAESVIARDAHTIVVRLKRPSAPFLAGFFRDGTQGAILPKHLLDGKPDLNRDPFNTKPIGSGPFVVTSYTAGQGIELAPNPHWYGGKPKLEHISYRVIPSENSLFVALQTHEVDLYWGLPEQEYAPAHALPSTTVVATPTNAREMLVFNTRREPFDDVRVRRAVANAVDWEGLEKRVYLGIGLPGTAATHVFPRSWAYTPVAPPFTHNVAAARTMLDAAGWKLGSDGVRERAGKRLTATIVSVAGVRPRENAEVVLQQALREIGIDLQVHNAPASLLFAPFGGGGLLAKGNFDLSIYSWLPYPDPNDSDTDGPDRVPPAGVNYAGLRDAELGRLQVAGASIYERAERKPIYAKLERRLTEMLPERTIVWRAQTVAYNDNLKNYRPAVAVSDFWNCAEWSI